LAVLAVFEVWSPRAELVITMISPVVAAALLAGAARAGAAPGRARADGAALCILRGMLSDGRPSTTCRTSLVLLNLSVVLVLRLDGLDLLVRIANNHGVLWSVADVLVVPARHVEKAMNWVLLAGREVGEGAKFGGEERICHEREQEIRKVWRDTYKSF
jgi:hypothetical protein